MEEGRRKRREQEQIWGLDITEKVAMGKGPWAYTVLSFDQCTVYSVAAT